MDADAYRRKLEADILKIMEQKLLAGEMDAARAIADYVNKYWDFSKALLFIRGPFDQMKFLSDVNEEGLMQLLNNLN